MVYRIFVEKKENLAFDAKALYNEAKNLLGISTLEKVRILNRYDAENISDELFDYAVKTVFSEPQVDIVSGELHAEGGIVFAVEYLPGQFDQRADSAAQCIQIMSGWMNGWMLIWMMIVLLSCVNILMQWVIAMVV